VSNYPTGSEHNPQAPWNEEDKNNNCYFCGEPISGKYYCNKICEKSDMSD